VVEGVFRAAEMANAAGEVEKGFEAEVVCLRARMADLAGCDRSILDEWRFYESEQVNRGEAWCTQAVKPWRGCLYPLIKFVAIVLRSAR
jgi:hypothetical protein